MFYKNNTAASNVLPDLLHLAHLRQVCLLALKDDVFGSNSSACPSSQITLGAIILGGPKSMIFIKIKENS